MVGFIATTRSGAGVVPFTILARIESGSNTASMVWVGVVPPGGVTTMSNLVIAPLAKS